MTDQESKQQMTSNYSPADTVSPNLYRTSNGEAKTLGQWAKQLGTSREVLRYRLKSGWPIDEALTAPIRRLRRYPKSRAKPQQHTKAQSRKLIAQIVAEARIALRQTEEAFCDNLQCSLEIYFNEQSSTGNS